MVDMPQQYVKRNQMAFDFTKTPLPPLWLPTGYRYVAWEPELVEVHADVKHRGFRDDSDADIFPTFRSYDRCLRLMEVISDSLSFLPEATVLVAFGEDPDLMEYVANIQGMRHSKEVGAIQNVAVLPDHRGRGVGRGLVLGCLHGFRNAGVQRVTLEVTADNIPAVKLYERLGFRTFKVYFREIFPGF